MKISDKAYLVYVGEDEIDIVQCNTVSITTHADGFIEFKGEYCNGYKAYHKSNKYVPITEEEVAKLFLEENETLEQG